MPETPIRSLPPAESRVETGPVQHGDDWPGVFVRGDDAAAFVPALRFAAATLRKGPFVPDQLHASALASLAAVFESCNLSRPDA